MENEHTVEKQWIKFQLDIASARGALGPLYQIACDARRRHTFHYGDAPVPRMVHAMPGVTPGVPNGVPDAALITTHGSYAARALSVMAASSILLWIDAAIQDFARTLGQPVGPGMMAGDLIETNLDGKKIPASTFVWAGANNVRHVDEWFAFARRFVEPQCESDYRLREIQKRSMEPLGAVLGCNLPIVENVSFEVFQTLTSMNSEIGSFERLELHALRIGQDLAFRSGLPNAIIGVTIKGITSAPLSGDTLPDNIIRSDGIARSASSLPDNGRLLNVRPMED